MSLLARSGRLRSAYGDNWLRRHARPLSRGPPPLLVGGLCDARLSQLAPEACAASQPLALFPYSLTDSTVALLPCSLIGLNRCSLPCPLTENAVSPCGSRISAGGYDG